MGTYILATLAGAMIWELIRQILEHHNNPYKLSCIHCKNGGNGFVISSNDKVLLGQVMDKHKRDVHPYAA